MGMNNAQLTEANKGLTESLNKANEKLEVLSGVSDELDETKKKLITANRENATLKTANGKLEEANEKLGSTTSSDSDQVEDEDAADEKALEFEALKAATLVRRKPVLEKREKNRAGRPVRQLNKKELKIEEKCNAELRKLNMIINGETASDVLA